MKYFMIIAKVNKVEFLTKVGAESEYEAEHMVLDLAYCGKHTYGVESCMAYGREAMKTDTFIYNAIAAKPIQFEALKEVIAHRNEEIRVKDEAENRITAIEKQMKELQNELVKAKNILSA